MLATKILERVEAYIPDIQLQDMQSALNDCLNILDLKCNYIDTYNTALSILSGTQTLDSESSTLLTDSAQSFPEDDSLVGMTIKNITDGSEGTIASNTKTTLTVTELTGGTNNTWQANDVYNIESSRISIPRNIVKVDEVYLTVNDDVYLLPQDLTIEEYMESTYQENYMCLIKDRIIYFPGVLKTTDTLKLVCVFPHTEYTSLFTTITEIDIADKYLQILKDYIIKEVCNMPSYREKYDYLKVEFEQKFNHDLLSLKANRSTGNFSMGVTF